MAAIFHTKKEEQRGNTTRLWRYEQRERQQKNTYPSPKSAKNRRLSLFLSVAVVGGVESAVVAFVVGVLLAPFCTFCKEQILLITPVHKQRVPFRDGCQTPCKPIHLRQVLCARLWERQPSCHPEVLPLQYISVDLSATPPSLQLLHLFNSVHARGPFPRRKFPS